MARHDVQMRALLSRVVLLDDDGVARTAGEIFDEPALARPIGGDELNGLLPESFFVLQDELKARARRLVIASQSGTTLRLRMNSVPRAELRQLPPGFPRRAPFRPDHHGDETMSLDESYARALDRIAVLPAAEQAKIRALRPTHDPATPSGSCSAT